MQLTNVRINDIGGAAIKCPHCSELIAVERRAVDRRAETPDEQIARMREQVDRLNKTIEQFRTRLGDSRAKTKD